MSAKQPHWNFFDNLYGYATIKLKDSKKGLHKNAHPAPFMLHDYTHA